MDDEFVEKHKGLKIILKTFIVLIILGGIGFGGYLLLQKTLLNPEIYLTETKEYLSSDLFKDFKLINSNEKDSSFNGTITFKTDNKDISYLNKISIDYNVLSSYLNEEMQANIKYNEDNKNILSSNIYLIKDSLYLDSNDLYNKVLLINKYDYNIYNDIKDMDKKSNDSLKGINNYFENLLKALKEMNMKSEMVSIYKVKYTYEINDSNRDKIQNKYDELIKNDKTIQMLIKEKVIDKELFNVKFSNLKVEIIKSIGTNKIYNINVFENNKKTFTLEIDSNDDSKYHLKYNENVGTLIIDKDTYTLQLFEKDVLVNTIKLVNNNNLFKISITSEDGDLSFGLKKENKNKYNVTLTYKMKNKDSFDMALTINKNNDQYQVSSVIDMVTNGEKFRIKLDGKMEYGDNLLTPKELSNVVDYKILSEKEQTKISENLMKKLQNSKLFEIFMKEDNI